MKYIKILLFALLLLSISLGFALSQNQIDDEKTMTYKRFTNYIFSFETANNATIRDLKVFENLDMISQSGPWISGKKQRRDYFGRKLYWLQYPPTPANQYLVNVEHPDWNEDLVPVIDTLTTVAYDGDYDLFELLPAYNSIIRFKPELSHLYHQYNLLDDTLQSIAGIPSPLPYDPFDSDTFCFSISQDEAFDAPGFITYSSFYYDYCPFGTPDDRDWGGSKNRNEHWPLGIAVHQESFYSPVQNHEWLMINKYDIYNMNEEDSIEDIAFGQFVNADIGPADWDDEKIRDDVSGYFKGEGYEFSYSRDYDGDGGLSPYIICVKTIINEHELNHASWYWKIGDGPDDFYPCTIITPIPSKQTANEKHWLLTGRNPNDTKFRPLRRDADETHYEQYPPVDTRFLHSVYGSQPGDADYNETDTQGNYINRINLAAGEHLTVYVVYFIADGLEDMKTKSLLIEDMKQNDFQIDYCESLTSVPYLRNPDNRPPDSFSLSWASPTMPDHYELMWKEYGAPASTWNSVELEGNTNDYLLGGLDPNKWYEIKVAAIFYNPQEVYLESQVRLVNVNIVSVEDESLVPMPQLSSYPNPFAERATILYELKEAGEAKAMVYNLKGQLVKELISGHQSTGQHQLTWDGKNSKGETCSDGVYLLRVQNGKQALMRKILKLK